MTVWRIVPPSSRSTSGLISGSSRSQLSAGRVVEGPDQLAGGRIARHRRGAPVVAVVGKAAILVEGDDTPLTTVVGVPRAAIAGRVVEEVDLGIPGEVAPDRTAATTPAVAVPGRANRVLLVRVERIEARADADFVVGAHVVHHPLQVARVDVERLHLAADATLAAGDCNNA